MKAFRYLLVVLLLQMSVPTAQAGTLLSAGEVIAFSIETANETHVGEPFDYTVRVVYRSDQVAPDFPALIRDIRFVPFEQLYLSRPQTRTVDHGNGVQEYVLTYPLQGINVIPHQSYPLDPVTLHWRLLSDSSMVSQTVQPGPVTITGYYSADVTGQTFQSLRRAIDDRYRLKQAGMAILFLVALAYGISRIRRAAAIRTHLPITHADQIREQFNRVEGSPREQLLAYERILLALLFYYRRFSAREFWQSASLSGADWRSALQQLKRRLNDAYRERGPDAAGVLEMRDSLESVFASVAGQVQAEKQAQLDKLKGTVWQRLRAERRTFIRGAVALLLSVLLLLMLIRPSLWRDPDVRLYNSWIEGLPARLFDSAMDSRLSSVDVELLVQISEQQEVLQQLNSDLVKGAYLYNFGTIIAKAYIAILAAEDQPQEEFEENEAGASRPSFEFPKQLLANAVRLAPLREDPRRNLELAIMLREAEKKDEESGKTEGEVGPPLPGFSRDLNPVLF